MVEFEEVLEASPKATLDVLRRDVVTTLGHPVGNARFRQFRGPETDESQVDKKGFLVLHGVDFPYTHNIARLLELCAEHGTWTKVVKDAEELTPFAITARYPGDDEPVTESDARRAIDIARAVRRTVSSALIADGIALT